MLLYFELVRKHVLILYFFVKFKSIIKIGRTHLMDAMPLTFGQELNAWASQIKDIKDQLIELLPHIQKLALGGTAVGTGVNAHSEMASRATHILNQKTGMNFAPNSDSFRAMSSQDTSLNLSSKTRTFWKCLGSARLNGIDS